MTDDEIDRLRILSNMVNHIASEKIINIAPLYAQNNMLAEAIYAIKRNNKDQLVKFEVLWDRINKIRQYSDTLKQRLKGDLSIDIYTGWPE